MNLSNKTVHAIIDALISQFALVNAEAVTFDDLRGESRTDALSLKRAEVMFVLRNLGLSFSEIGTVLKRDHTTVIAAQRRVVVRMNTHVGYKDEISRLLDMARGVVVLAQKESRMRERLSDEREGYTHKVEIISAVPGSAEKGEPETYSTDVYITVSEYSDGRLGEIFLKIGRHGDEHAIYDAWARSTSFALQHGASVKSLFTVGAQYEPFGATSNKNIPRCSSILDYVSRWVRARYLKENE